MFFGKHSTIRFQLTCLVVACVLPVWLVAGILVLRAYSSKLSEVKSDMLETSRSVTMTVDLELTSVQAGLLALATSPSFRRADFADVHRQSLELLKSYPGADIIVADLDGQQLVNTFRPYGTPLPKRNNPEMVHSIFASGKPIVSNLFFGAVTRRPLISIDVPVFVDGRVVYDLSMTFSSDRLSSLLSQQDLPKGGYSSILDSQRVIVARTEKAAQYVGKQVTLGLRQAMAKTHEGTAEMTNVAGTRVFVSFSQSTMSGWAVSVGIPRAVVMKEIYRWMGWAVGGATAISLTGILLALGIARRIARAIQSLVNPALAIGRGEPVTTIAWQPVKETFDVANALVQASELQQRQVETMRHQQQVLQQSEERYRDANENLQTEIDERQGAQADLAVKQQQLEEANRSLGERIAVAVAEIRQKDQVLITQSRQAAMGEMIGNIAHQWRQPLNALGLLLANIKDAYHFGDLSEAYLDQAVADGNRLVQKMSMTINDFRNFFNPGKENVPFSVRQQIREAIVLVEASFRNDNIRISLQAAQDLTLFGFPNEYSQVLLNLFTNAKEAIKASGVALGSVEVGLAESDGQGFVTVSDNGGGIPAESLDRIFEPYFSTKEMGTGIGLYMSKMIIERNMHGSIEARNTEDGAEFTIRTPLAKGQG